MPLYPSYNNGTIIQMNISTVSNVSKINSFVYVRLSDGQIISPQNVVLIKDYKFINFNPICCGFTETCDGWQLPNPQNCWLTALGESWLTA